MTMLALRQRKVFGQVAAKDPEPEPLRKFSSTQVNITGRPAEMMRKMAAGISPADIGADGIEHQPHITLKWGIHFQSPSKRLRDALKVFGPITVTLGKTSLFKNEDADVLKAEVDSPDLHRLNKLISRILPTKDTHPTYIPHATICYLKPGRGAKYAGSTALSGQKLDFDSIVFSGRKGHMENIPLTAVRRGGMYRAR